MDVTKRVLPERGVQRQDFSSGFCAVPTGVDKLSVVSATVQAAVVLDYVGRSLMMAGTEGCQASYYTVLEAIYRTTASVREFTCNLTNTCFKWLQTVSMLTCSLSAIILFE